jgi:hypothetical protein
MARARPNLEKAINDILLRHGVDGKRLSLRQAERLTGLSPATIGELAKGNARTPETLRRFAQGMNEDTGRLLLLAGFMPPEEPAAAPVAPACPPTGPDAQETILLARLELALTRLPPGRDRELWKAHLRHTADLLERFLETN